MAFELLCGGLIWSFTPECVRGHGGSISRPMLWIRPAASPPTQFVLFNIRRNTHDIRTVFCFYLRVVVGVNIINF